MLTPGLPLLYFKSMLFLKTNISEGGVATPFSYGVICNDLFIANFLENIILKEL